MEERQRAKVESAGEAGRQGRENSMAGVGGCNEGERFAVEAEKELWMGDL